EAIDQQRRRAPVAERAEHHAEVSADPRIVALRLFVDRGHLLLEIGITRGLSPLERFGKLIGRLPALMRAAGTDGVQIVGDRMLFGGELAEEEEDPDRY